MPGRRPRLYDFSEHRSWCYFLTRVYRPNLIGRRILSWEQIFHPPLLPTFVQGTRQERKQKGTPVSNSQTPGRPSGHIRKSVRKIHPVSYTRMSIYWCLASSEGILMKREINTGEYQQEQKASCHQNPADSGSMIREVVNGVWTCT